MSRKVVLCVLEPHQRTWRSMEKRGNCPCYKRRKEETVLVTYKRRKGKLYLFKRRTEETSLLFVRKAEL